VGGRARVPRFGRARVGVEMLVFGVLAVAVVLGAVPASAQAVATWKFAGQGISDGRSQPAETLLTPANVPTLAPKWVLKTHGNVSATPTVAGGTVYFPDGGGYVYAV